MSLKSSYIEQHGEVAWKEYMKNLASKGGTAKSRKGDRSGSFADRGSEAAREAQVISNRNRNAAKES